MEPRSNPAGNEAYETVTLIVIVSLTMMGCSVLKEPAQPDCAKGGSLRTRGR